MKYHSTEYSFSIFFLTFTQRFQYVAAIKNDKPIAHNPLKIGLQAPSTLFFRLSLNAWNIFKVCLPEDQVGPYRKDNNPAKSSPLINVVPPGVCLLSSKRK